MPYVDCPECGYRVGIGVATEPDRCPECDIPMMYTSEMRALTAEEIHTELDRQADCRETRRSLPLSG